jgi:hypothetical protein
LVNYFFSEHSVYVLHQGKLNDISLQFLYQNEIFLQIDRNYQSVTPIASEQNIVKLFTLFYRNKPYPILQLIHNLQTVVGTPASIEGWRNALVTTCTSSHWQAL